jgi:hypothetical protein
VGERVQAQTKYGMLEPGLQTSSLRHPRRGGKSLRLQRKPHTLAEDAMPLETCQCQLANDSQPSFGLHPMVYESQIVYR